MKTTIKILLTVCVVAGFCTLAAGSDDSSNDRAWQKMETDEYKQSIGREIMYENAGMEEEAEREKESRRAWLNE